MLYFRWTILQIKLHMRTVSFWILMAAATMLLLLAKNYRSNPEKTILLQRGEGEVREAICERILSDNLPGYIFTVENSEEEIRRRISSGEAVCGICFSGDPDDSAGETEIVVYATPKTVDGMVIREVVFPYLLRVQSDGMLRGYLEGKGVLPEDIENIAELNQRFLKLKDISIFTVQEVKVSKKRLSAAQVSLRDVLFLILGAALTLWYAVMVLRADHPVYHALTKGRAAVLRLIGAAARVLVTLGALVVINIILK